GHPWGEPHRHGGRPAVGRGGHPHCPWFGDLPGHRPAQRRLVNSLAGDGANRMTTTAAPAAMPISAANPLLSGRILPTLLRLAFPNVLAMSATVVVGIAEISYIGILGTEPLAAMALVFPFAMLTQMMSAGAMGGGVSSAVSRALGAGNVIRARALALHAVAIGTIAGVLYSVLFLAFGPDLYRLLGGSGRVLVEATHYSNVLFSGAVLIWLSNSLASVLRGTGNMRLPSITILVISVLQILLGGSLGLGLG